MGVPMGKITDLEFYSEALQEYISMLVYVPANYSPLYKYTMCIANDGKDYFQMGRIGRVADRLLHEGKIGNVIIVGIPYLDAQDRRRKYHPQGEKNEAYIRFLAHELAPFLDAEFPAYGVGRGRVLMGDSLAGTVSLLTALRYPNIFGKVVMQSPYVDDVVMQAAEQFKEPHLLQLYHVIGKHETDVPTTNGEISNFIEPNRKLHALLAEKAFPMFYEEFDGNHTWKYWQKDVPRALETIAALHE
ncbi:MAG: alpha/beta hydrolase [Bacillus sp. (in: firmicutes)]